MTECGTIAARALFMVFYRDQGGVQLAQFQSCCAEHEPRDFTVLIDEAEIVQTDIADGYEQVVTTDLAALTYQSPRPGYYIDPEQPWSWTLANNHPVKSRPFDPDKGFHVTEGRVSKWDSETG